MLVFSAMRKLALSIALLATLLLAPATEARRYPNIVFVTIDTLRADRMGAWGYDRATTPKLDRLLARGARFDQGYTVEPLTNPSLASMVTSVHPHEHGSTRNGIPIRPGLDSLGKILEQRGFATAAFVGNWTLKSELSGLQDHFATYEEVFSRKRWFLIKGEATARDLSDEALGWIEDQVDARPTQPFFLWLHYVEPHAPYRLQEDMLEQLGLADDAESLGAGDRYDSEVAFVDAAVGRFLDGLYEHSPSDETLIVFSADHGESLGEHGYWGHGRNLYDESVRIPMGIVWPGRVKPGTVLSSPASIIDLAPTVLGLLDHPLPGAFRGFDWSGVLDGSEAANENRAILLQAHKGAVQGIENPHKARRRGLLEVAVLRGGKKEVYRLPNDSRAIFDLLDDPAERRDLAKGNDDPSPALASWRRVVESGLEVADRIPAPAVDGETEEQMRALGYLD